jgi:transcriptional regulator
MLYTPAAFRESELPKLHDHITACGLAMLVTASESGPLVSHLPFVLKRGAGAYGELVGHLARPNPQWRESDLSKPAVAVFMGPDAYVSPSWYPTKQTDARVVPTWNYTVVHARGRLEIFEDAESLHTNVTELTQLHEGRFAAPWDVTDAPADFIQRMLRGIVGVRLFIEQLEGKAKLGQNRSEADRQGTIDGLGTSERERDRDVAALMRETMNKA